MRVKIIMGAGYGDEGKGLMTDYFCYEMNKEYNNWTSHGLTKSRDKVLNVKVNGGAQAGHTVCRLDKSKGDYKHWVFRQYGSGTFAGADTYLLNTFMLNLIELISEYRFLKETYNINTKLFIDRRCKITLPMDVLMNRLIEDKRTHRHGSCGLGIYETFHRNNDFKQLTINDIVKKFIELTLENFEGYLYELALQYYDFRLNELKTNENIEIGIEEYNELLDKTVKMNKELIQNLAEIGKLDNIAFCNDMEELIEKYNYKAILFEGSQGLELDQYNKRNWPHLTPSNTGLINSIQEIKNNKYISNCEVEACFITRSYKTKHGAGNFVEENSEVQNIYGLYDRTNQPNQYQGTLKYGLINLGRIKKLITEQLEYTTIIEGKDIKFKVGLAITHLDQTNSMVLTQNGNVHFSEIKEMTKGLINRYYYSFGEKAEDIINE